MKIRAYLGAFIAFIILTGSPFSTLLDVNAGTHNGLVCFCCKDAKIPCVMISCSCCNDQTDRSIPQWMPEIIFNSQYPSNTIEPARGDTSCSRIPESIYLDVPLKPPESACRKIASV